MKGIRFYLEYQNKTKDASDNHLGRVLAVFYENYFLSEKYTINHLVCIWKLCPNEQKRTLIKDRVTCPICNNGLSPYKYLQICYDAIGSLLNEPNSEVCSTSVAQDYLQENCKRISEKRARNIHPNLFKVLDQE